MGSGFSSCCGASNISNSSGGNGGNFTGHMHNTINVHVMIVFVTFMLKIVMGLKREVCHHSRGNPPTVLFVGVAQTCSHSCPGMTSSLPPKTPSL